MTLDYSASTFDDGSLELDVAATLLRVSSVLRSRLDNTLRRERISWAGYEVLDVLCARGPMSYKSISQKLGRHRTSVAAIVSGLVSSGVVARRLGGDRSDEFVVEATRSGLLIHDRAGSVLASVASDLLSSGDSNLMLQGLLRLEGGLRGH